MFYNRARAKLTKGDAMPTANTAPPLQIISAALPPELAAQLRAMARREERSLSDVTRRIIRRALAEASDQTSRNDQ